MASATARSSTTWTPPIRVVLQAQPCHVAAAAHAVQRGVQPQGKQIAWVDRCTTGIAAPGLDRLDQLAQVLVHDVAPHQPGPMVLCQQRFKVRRTQLNLRAVGFEQSHRSLGLPARRLGFLPATPAPHWVRATPRTGSPSSAPCCDQSVSSSPETSRLCATARGSEESSRPLSSPVQAGRPRRRRTRSTAWSGPPTATA
jgi:hypothetical protein